MERGNRRAPKTDPGSLVTGLAGKLSELEHAVTLQAERFAAVIDIGTQISSARDIDHLLRTVMDRLTGLVGATAATLFMHDEQTRELWSRVVKGDALKELRIPQTAGIAGHVFTSGKTLVLGDAYADVRFNPEVDRKSGFRTRSVIAAPLRHISGKVLGVLQVLDGRIDAFTVGDRALVEGVASQVAAVLDNVLLLEQVTSRNQQLKRATDELERRVSELDVLYDVEKDIAEADAEVDLLERILTRAMQVLKAGAGSILLLEPDRESLFFRTAKGEKSDALKALRLEPGQGIAGHVAQSGEVVRVAKAEASPHFDKALAKRLGAPVGAVLCVPIHADHRNLGALELLNKKNGFTESDQRLAVLLAGQVGHAIVLRRSKEEGERRARLAAIGQLLSSVLHDLKTPMMVVSGYAEMMVDEGEPEVRREMARMIETQIQTLAAMQRETLAFARGEQTVFLRKVHLNAFMKELGEQLEQQFAQTKVELKLVADYAGSARFDEIKMKRAMHNLARNALDAMPSGGRFTLTVDREGKDLIFKAADNGPGIPAEIADRLFESFVTAGKKQGTGLGLAIVKKIAKEHHGSVECQTRPGKGTTFVMRFPAGLPAT